MEKSKEFIETDIFKVAGEKYLPDITMQEMKGLMESMGEPSYKAVQVFRWVAKGAVSFDEMTDISKAMRDKLCLSVSLARPVPVERHVSKNKDVIRLKYEYRDGAIAESVLMKYKHGYSVCISSQSGCRMGCTFCASTGTGFGRDLTSGEMLDQVAITSKNEGVRISNVVVMGIGEPFDNYENLLAFLELVNHKDGLNIGMRHISVSTCGLVPQILDLAKRHLQLTLSVSLHCADDEKRSRLMPVNKRYSIDNLITACKIYTENTRRRITFEYAMIDGFNDDREDALLLAKKLKGMLCHVNLIPLNKVEGKPYKKSNAIKIEEFKKLLQQKGIETTVRRELGSDIDAACGQLRRNSMLQQAEGILD